MTLPAFKAVGTGSETAPAWPTHAAGDFALLCVSSANNTDTALIDTPSGWTAILALESFAGNHVRLSVFYRFATSSSETAPTLSGPNAFGYKYGTIVTYTGVNTATPINGISQQAMNSQATQWLPGISTFIDDCMIVHVVTYNNDDAGPLFSGETNSTLGSLTERFDAGTITGNGGGIYVCDGTLATHGTCGPTQVTMSTGGGLAAVTLALQAADKQDNRIGQRTRQVNTGM
jgi:hypothetical protein